MSGYLTRMVAAAARPERRIRPFAGSIYAPSQTEPGGAESGLVVDEQVTLRNSPSAAPSTERPTRQRAASAEAAARPAAEAARTGTRRPLARAAPSPPAASPPALPIGDTRAPPALGRQTEPAAAAAEPKPAEARRPATYEPIRVERARLVETWREPPSEPAAVAASPLFVSSRLGPPQTFARPAPLPPRGRTPAPAREAGDDIQIQIGRIEVIAPPAVPAAPTQAAAPRPPRSTSLRDYLNRGGRRSP